MLVLHGTNKLRDLNEYTETTSEYELFAFLYDRVISGEITKFSELKEFTKPILKSQRVNPIIIKVFNVIKKLHWGFFSDMTKDTHLRLWKEMVIPDREFPEAGDIKDTLQISDLYIAMLDIHGYTQFCMDSRKNLSMLHTLDWAMNTAARRISTACQALSQRERGDEMVVVAATATDAITVTIAIIDYFAKTNLLNDPKFPPRGKELPRLCQFSKFQRELPAAIPRVPSSLPRREILPASFLIPAPGFRQGPMNFQARNPGLWWPDRST